MFGVVRNSRVAVAAESFLVVVWALCSPMATAQDVKRVVALDQMESPYGEYRIVLELDPNFAGGLMQIRDVGEPSLFVGDQKVIHFVGLSGNLLTGFLKNIPGDGELVWIGPPETASFTITEARDAFDARAFPPIIVNASQLLAVSDGLRKRITNVVIELASKPATDGSDQTIYVVKLAVANMTAANFVEPGPFGRPVTPTVYVDDQAAESTRFSEPMQVLGEFHSQPNENGLITLRYPHWMLTVPSLFRLPSDPVSRTLPWSGAPTSHRTSLRAAQSHFRTFGAYNEANVPDARPPSHDDERDPSWNPSP